MKAKIIIALVLVTLIVGGGLAWQSDQQRKADIASGVSNGTIGMVAPPVAVSLKDAAFRELYTIGFGISGFRLKPDGSLVTHVIADSGSLGCRTDSMAMDASGKTLYIGCTSVRMAQEGISSILPFHVKPTGWISPQHTFRVITGHDPFAMTMARGKYLYVSSNDGIFQYETHPDGQIEPLVPFQVSKSIVAAKLAISADGRSAYATNFRLNRIYQFRINDNGTLTSLNPGYITTGNGPMEAITDRLGKYVWCVASGDGAIDRFAVKSDGSLSLLAPSTTILGHEPSSIALTADGKHAYVARFRYDSVMMFDVASDGTFTPQSPLSVPGQGSPATLRIDPSGKYLFAINTQNTAISIYHVNASGGLDQAAPSAILTGPLIHELAFLPKTLRD